MTLFFDLLYIIEGVLYNALRITAEPETQPEEKRSKGEIEKEELLMINEKVKSYLEEKGFGDRLEVHDETIDTVEHAALQIGCTEAEIAKTLSFLVDGMPVIIVMAGDGRVNSSKFKAKFHTKPSMIPRDRVEELTGFQPGGVCPFGVSEDIPVWLDVSMKRFEYVHPAAGNEFTSARLTPEELEKASRAAGWCDVCKGWEEEEP